MSADAMKRPQVIIGADRFALRRIADGGPIWEAHEVRTLVATAYMVGYQMAVNDQERARAGLVVQDGVTAVAPAVRPGAANGVGAVPAATVPVVDTVKVPERLRAAPADNRNE